MNEDDFGVLVGAILSDNRLCHHLREAPDEAEFWRRLESLAEELNLRPDFGLMHSAATGALSFWLAHWSAGGAA